MYPLPPSEQLPVHKLLACFNNTAATYKFYWLLSVLDQVEQGHTRIPKRALFAGMVSHAWYPVHYFHINFGPQDLLAQHAREIQKLEQISISDSRQEIWQALMEAKNPKTMALLAHFNNNVPHWFLSPWFPGSSRAEIYAASQEAESGAPYAQDATTIQVHPLWAQYFTQHGALIRSFCYWRLALYLQAKNPNVPDIPNKLIKPAQRNSLNRQRAYWNLVFHRLNPITCIYTDASLDVGEYAVEHFIPYNFVSHDLLWNLIPASPSFNSKKSDKLPPLERYFEPFYLLQKQSLEVMKQHHPTHPLLEDYYSIFPDLDSSINYENFLDRVKPLVSIAANNGFEFMHV